MLDQFLKMPIAKKILVLGVVVVLVGLVFWQFYYSPSLDELQGVKKAHTQMQSKLAEAQARKKTYDEDVQRMEDLKIASVKQRQMLPVESEMASFLNNLNSVAELTGLEILSVTPMAEAPEKYYATIPVKLELEGSFLQLSKFFYQVGKLDRIINIVNISFDKPKISENGAVMKASVRAVTFRSLDKAK
ncbi:MAG: type 4a pilus biogenesis protein PilO [Deltaproteobacteria bacterium]|nr:type 4a pilus biogenesis protein PilO [Deltaproteobacteria bacterium]MBN2672137.1 type 4a pilus biogenesis protein PilO [Deltaproteobacteria bacterium]